MASIDNIKRGDTFQLTADLKDENGTALVLSLANIKSQIRKADDTLVAELTIATTGTPGTYTLTCIDTQEWPAPASLVMDIEMIINGQKRSSDTIAINVIKDVTR